MGRKRARQKRLGIWDTLRANFVDDDPKGLIPRNSYVFGDAPGVSKYGRYLGFPKNVWQMTHFPKNGLSGCGFDPLRGTLRVHVRSGLHLHLIPRSGREIEAGTANGCEEVSLLQAGHIEKRVIRGLESPSSRKRKETADGESPQSQGRNSLPGFQRTHRVGCQNVWNQAAIRRAHACRQCQHFAECHTRCIGRSGVHHRHHVGEVPSPGTGHH